MPDLAAERLARIRERAERHELELHQASLFLTTADVARRWGCSRQTVRAVPLERLPYLNLGHGLVKELRRYRLEDVEAYERVLLERAG